MLWGLNQLTFNDSCDVFADLLYLFDFPWLKLTIVTTRVTLEEEHIPIGAYVRAQRVVPDTPLNPSENMITRKVLDEEIAQDVQATLPNVIAYTYDVILGESVGDIDRDEEYYEYSTPISNHDPSIIQHSRHNNNSVWNDCS